MAYTRAQDVQIDSWETIGNPGWNWQNLFPYYIKSESFQPPTQSQALAGASYNPKDHGDSGPLAVGWPLEMVNGTLPGILNSTYQVLGVPWLSDINSGQMHGYNVYPMTVNRTKDIRDDAATAYYWPYKGRGNLHLMTKKQVNRIIWAPDPTGGNATATGVEVIDNKGKKSVIKCKREVILAAGALRSASILEVSGVGNPNILKQYGINTTVDLPSVGENLQDQTNNDLTITTSNQSASFVGIPSYVAYPSIKDLFDKVTVSGLFNVTSQNLSSYAATVAAANGNVTSQTALLNLFQIQHNLIFNSSIPIAEILVEPSSTQINFEYWGLLPFARGSVHISSNQSAVPPTINPNYFMLDWDLFEQIGTAKFIRRFINTDPFRELVGSEVKPGIQTIPPNATDDAWRAWIVDSCELILLPIFHSSLSTPPSSLSGISNITNFFNT
jgi:choline dehydrogenase-like flavoprotein